MVKVLLRDPSRGKGCSASPTVDARGTSLLPSAKALFWKRGEDLSCSEPEASTREWNYLGAEFSHFIATKNSPNQKSLIVDGLLQSCSHRGWLTDCFARNFIKGIPGWRDKNSAS